MASPAIVPDCSYFASMMLWKTKDVFLLIYSANKNMFQIIPKRAFASKDDELEFKELLVSKKLKNKSNFAEIKQKPFLMIILIGFLVCCISVCSASIIYMILRSS